MHIVDGHMYIFSGVHMRAMMGCNLLMDLDLKNRTWKHLSGTVLPTPDTTCPGPRRGATSWVDEELKKIYIMFGEIDRRGASVTGIICRGQGAG